MADKVEVSNWPNNSVKERVAFELMEIIRVGIGYPKDEKTVLDLYARCLQATSGWREIS